MSITKSKTTLNGVRYKYELNVDDSLVYTLLGNKYIQDTKNSFKKKMEFTLIRPKDGEKAWTFCVYGKHRRTVKEFGTIVTKHYSKMVDVVNAIVERNKAARVHANHS